MFRQWLHETLAGLYPGHDYTVLVPPDAVMGDYSSNAAMVLAQSEGKNPRDVAAEMCAQLMARGTEFIARCEPAGPGFVNIFLKDEHLQQQLGALTIPQEGKGKKVIVEYPSTNVAKRMHVGHARTSFIGDALARVHRALGYEVVRWDHIGDWGTQFGMIIAAYKEWGNHDAVKDRPLETLNDLYVRWRAKEKDDSEAALRARHEFLLLEQGDAENLALWRWFVEESLKESHRMYERLDLLPVQKEVGESQYTGALPKLLDELQAQGVAKESDGALVVDLERFGLPTALVRKSDGASVYLTRDIASLQYRITTERPDRVLYVVGNEQSLHLQQLFAIALLMQLGQVQLVHVKYGLILGESGKKLSSREGASIFLNDVVDKAVSLAAEKNPEVAEAVGIGALKYNDLRQHPHTDITFDWNAMLDLGGDSGPYLQYTHARLAGIIAKVGNLQLTTYNLQLLIHPSERALMRHMLDFGYVVSQCAQLYALNGLALYLSGLAEKANRFYEQVRIGEDDNDARKHARLILVQAVMAHLKTGLSLLGIQTPDRI
jgi:arginyl-tRNA synthetase